MKKKSIRIYAIATLVILAPVLFVYLSFTNSVDCSQLVIDTYEVTSGINIPEVDFVNCYYDEKLNTRISVYDLVGQMDLDKFESVSAAIPAAFLQGKVLLAENELPQESEFVLASGEKRGKKWTYLVDKTSGRLWAELNY